MTGTMRNETAAVSTQPEPRERYAAALFFIKHDIKTEGLEALALRRTLAATQVNVTLDGKSDRYLDALCDRVLARMDASTKTGKQPTPESRPTAQEVLAKTQAAHESVAQAQFNRRK